MSELDTAIRQFRRLRAFYREVRCYEHGGHDYEHIYLVNDIGDLSISRCRKCGWTVSYQFGRLQTKGTTIDPSQLDAGFTYDVQRS